MVQILASTDHPCEIEKEDGKERAESFHKPWWTFCFGHCPSLTIYLDSKSGFWWIFPKLLNVLMRGIGQVVFANNPFSGLLILISFAWYSWYLAGIVVAAANIAIITALATKQPLDCITNGLVTFNAVLIATVNFCIWERTYNHELPIKIYILILLSAFISVFIFDGLSNLLSTFRPPIPILSIPFHIVILAFFMCMKPNTNFDVEEEKADLYLSVLASGNNNVTTTDCWSWGTLQKSMYGSTVAASMVFGFPSLVSSLLITIAMFIYSPLLASMSAYGAFVSTITGLLFTTFPNDQVFQGVYGFNGFLSSSAITIFYVFNQYSFVSATANSIFTAVVQISLSALFSQALPVLGLPFLTSTIIFISMTGDTTTIAQHFIRLGGVITYPEMDRKLYYKRLRSKTTTGLEEDEERAIRQALTEASD